MESLLEMKASGFTPDALLNRPKLKPHENTYMGMFSDLTRSRPAGEGVASIPFTEFEKWCVRRCVTSETEFDRLYLYLQKMDDAYVTLVLERRKREMERNNKK